MLQHVINSEVLSNLRGIVYKTPRYTQSDDSTMRSDTPAVVPTVTMAIFEQAPEVENNQIALVNIYQDDKGRSLLHAVLHFSWISYIVGFLSISPLYITGDISRTTILSSIAVSFSFVLLITFKSWQDLQAANLGLQRLAKGVETKRDLPQQNLNTPSLEVDDDLISHHREDATKLEMGAFQENLKWWLPDELEETRGISYLAGTRAQEGQSGVSKAASDSVCTTYTDYTVSSTCPTSCDGGSSSGHDHVQTGYKKENLYLEQDQSKLIAQWVAASQRADRHRRSWRKHEDSAEKELIRELGCDCYGQWLSHIKLTRYKHLLSIWKIR